MRLAWSLRQQKGSGKLTNFSFTLNILKLQAVFNALKSFLPQVQEPHNRLATNLPVMDNGILNHLSREMLPFQEWNLVNRVVQKLFHFWPTPEIDLFKIVRNMSRPRSVPS